MYFINYSYNNIELGLIFYKTIMKETAIIYCRKSTDREELQQNSLEHQLNNCRNTIKNRDLVLLDEITESKSAKTEYERAGFNRMIDYCKKWKVDYIIIDETKRLSRNGLDSQRAIDLMDKNFIKWILSTWRQFLSDNSTDKFMLLFELWYSKKDNEDRSKDIKWKMITALHRWQWLSKAIFWYVNTWTKWNKDVKVVDSEAKLVLQSFMMRSQQEPLQNIANYLTEKTWKKWNSTRVSKMIKNTKYYWMQEFSGEKALLCSPWYKTIISKDLFDRANWVIKTRDYEKWWKSDLSRYFMWVLKDVDWNKLYPYETKKNIYYHQWSKTSYKVNVSQKWLFKEFEKHIDKYNFPKAFISLSKATLKEYYKDKVQNRTVELRDITIESNKFEKQLESLLDKYLDNDIDKTTYNVKKEKLEESIVELKERKKALKQDSSNIITIIEDLCELVENLSSTYKNWNEQKKGKIIRAMQCELFLDNKKQLTIKESKLFEMIKSLNINVWYSHGELNSSISLEKAAS